MGLRQTTISFILGRNDRPKTNNIMLNCSNKIEKKYSFANQDRYCRLRVEDLPEVKENRSQKIYKVEL